ncbi:MAG: ABC transporter permease [Verrucomicrobiota bacterium]
MVRSVYTLSIRQLLGWRRLLVLLGLAAVPLIPAAINAASATPWYVWDADRVLLDHLLAAAILPLVTLTIATAAFGNELEDKTLGNLTLTPVRRGRIVLAKLGAVLTVALPFVVASASASVLLGYGGSGIEGSGRAAVAAAVAFAVGVAVYSAVFLWLGLVTSHPLGFGLLYVFVWEGLFATFVSGIRYLSIRQYTLGVVATVDPSRFLGAGETIVGSPMAIAGSAAVFGAFILLAVRRLRRMDVV